MNVPFVCIDRKWRALKDKAEAAIDRTFQGGHFILGPEVTKFESAFAGYCEAEYCVGVGNGLDAIGLSLRACGVGQGDEVLVPAHTFIATWLAVSNIGARPVPVEVDAATYNIDPACIRASITDTTKAIIIVHLYGQPADVDQINQIAKEHKLAVIEDAAQAHGARSKDRRTGSLCDVAAFSFYPTKNLGCVGDGGAIVTSNEEIAEKVRRWGNYGSDQKYVHKDAGVNSRLDEIQASILNISLAELDAWNARRNEIADRYREKLAGDAIQLPVVLDDVIHVWHLFVVQVPNRAAFQEKLKNKGVSTLVHYPIPPHLQGAYKRRGMQKATLGITEDLCQRIVSLPMDPYLTDDEVDYVCECVNEIL